MKEKSSVKKILILVLISISGLSIIVGFMTFMAVKIKRELQTYKVLPESERVEIAEYLKDKYNKDFDVEVAESREVGFAVPDNIEAKCISKDKELTEFITTREEVIMKGDVKQYEDDYKERLLNNKIKKELEGQIKDIDLDAVLYVNCSYKNPIEDIYNNNLDKSKLEIDIEMAIPIEKNSSDEEYISKIRNMLKRDYEQNNRSLSLSVNFYDENYMEHVNKYYELRNITMTARMGKQSDYHEVYNIYYDSKINEFNFVS